MSNGKIALAFMGALLLTGCATSNPYGNNIPVEDRSIGRGVGAPQPSQPSVTPERPSNVVVTPVDPGLGVRPIEVEPIIRAQREVLPPADQVWQPSMPADSSQFSIDEPASMGNAAVVALLDSAQQESTQGDLRAAQTRLERAQRIAPREPEVYFQLADVKRQLGQFMDAEQVALRGVDVASGQSTHLRRLWALISQIRTEAGDLAGANDARVEASRH